MLTGISKYYCWLLQKFTLSPLSHATFNSCFQVIESDFVSPRPIQYQRMMELERNKSIFFLFSSRNTQTKKINLPIFVASRLLSRWNSYGATLLFFLSVLSPEARSLRGGILVEPVDSELVHQFA